MDSKIYKKFIKQILIYQVIFIICLMLFAYKIYFIEKIFGFQVLYAYQKTKILKSDEIDTVFLGDSSLGNAINAEYFNTLSGLKSINLALTGMYGYSGSYNILKSVEKKRKIKNVILVNTIDMMQRETAYDGYIYTMDDINDFTELKFEKRLVIIKTFFKIFLSKNNLSRFIEYYVLNKRTLNTIDNDYIKQNKPMVLSSYSHTMAVSNIPAERLFFLEKIKEYCTINNINLIYAHGPIYKAIGECSKSYVDYINQLIINKNIKLKKTVFNISDEEIGDSLDHVKKLYKNHFTEKYFHLIQHDLIY